VLPLYGHSSLMCDVARVQYKKKKKRKHFI
jgi:hypothetical protein